MKNYVRSILVTPQLLDNKLVELQDSGNLIRQIYPCPKGFKGNSDNVTKKRQYSDFEVEMEFVIVYLECENKTVKEEV